MSPTRRQLTEWLSTIEVKGSTLDIGGGIWSMRHKVKNFDGLYECKDEADFDLNILGSVWGIYQNVFCLEVMQFIYNPVAACRNFNRILPIGGNLYITFRFLEERMLRGHDALRYSRYAVEKILDRSGFKIIDIQEPTNDYYLVKAQKCSQS